MCLQVPLTTQVSHLKRDAEGLTLTLGLDSPEVASRLRAAARFRAGLSVALLSPGPGGERLPLVADKLLEGRDLRSERCHTSPQDPRAPAPPGFPRLSSWVSAGPPEGNK